MCETPGEMHMHDMVKFDIRVVLFEIALKAPPPPPTGVRRLKYYGSDRIHIELKKRFSHIVILT